MNAPLNIDAYMETLGRKARAAAGAMAAATTAAKKIGRAHV
jgi:hypothetical protein